MNTVIPTVAPIKRIERAEEKSNPFVSIIVPGYNEASIVEKNLQRI